MKRMLKIMLVLLVALMPFVTVDAKAKKKTTTTTTTVVSSEKVNLYLFYGDGCPHCEEFMEHLEVLEKDAQMKDMFNVVKLEVWYNEDNANLMNEVASALNTTANGVPFYVIGDKFFSGYAASMDTEINDAIKAAYKKHPQDVVAAVNKGEVIETTGSVSEDDNNFRIAIIALAVTVVIALLIIFGRTSNVATYYVDEEADEEVSEPVVVEEAPVKKVATKTATKKPATKTTTKATAKKTAAKTTAKKTAVKKTTKSSK